MYVEMGSLRKMKDDLSQWLDKSWGN
jgi:hypothetical protein